MSAMAVEPSGEHLELREAVASVAAGPFFEHPDHGRVVPIHVIRPGLGRGKGKHLYEAEMLERDARIFTGWRMFTDHLSDAAKRALGGLPRSLKDVGGIIKESYWDPTVPADPEKGFGQGAVIGLAKPTPLVRELIETDPEIVEASIAATATGVRQVQRGGTTCWLVEGISPRGSVDWVTEAGAGGRVAQLIEATREETLQEGRAIEAELLDSLSEEALVEYLRSSGRAALAEALLNQTKEDEVEITAEVLQEALDSDAGKAAIDAQVTAAVSAALSPERLDELIEAQVDARVATKVSETLAEERELLRVDTRADAERTLSLRDSRDFAHAKIEESRLPDAFKARLRSEFNLTESGPTAKLDVIDEIDGEGNVVKTARAILEESLAAALLESRELVKAANPTLHRGQGPSYYDDSEKPDPDKETEVKTTGSEVADDFLQEAGVSEEELPTLYDGIFALRG